MINPKSPLSKYSLDCEDVAKLLGYHVQYVRKLASTGKLPALKRGRQWIFSEEEIHAYLKQMTEEATHHDENPDDSILR